MDNSVGQRLERLQGEKKAVRKEWWIALAIFAVIVVIVLGAATLLVDRSTTVVSVEDAGQLVDAQFDSGLTADTTTVKTTKGTFQVYGTFQTLAGRTAEIRTFKNGDIRFCDTVTNTCKNFVK